MLYSELVLLGETYPDLMRNFNLQMAKGALEEKLADTGMSVDDLEQPALERHINELLMMQAGARWKARHRELQALREGLYADLYAEKEARAAWLSPSSSEPLRTAAWQDRPQHRKRLLMLALQRTPEPIRRRNLSRSVASVWFET